MKTALVTIAFVIIVLILVFLTIGNKKETPTPAAPISIEQQDIAEENFTGQVPVIKGTSTLATTAEKYVTDSIQEFRDRANKEVPDLQKEFGDSPTSHYTIDIGATYVVGNHTESIAVDQYVYTGGANGSSFYNVFTASKESGEILSLKDILNAGKEDAFVALVKAKILADTNLSIFEQDVQALTLDSLSDWAFDKENLIIYFDKYAIGPGAMGAIQFKIPLTELGEFLKSEYL